MNAQEIDRDVRSFLIDNFLFGRTEELRDDIPLQGNVMDSTGALELVAYLQEHFDITVEDYEVIPENLESVQTVVAYVARKVAAKTELPKTSKPA
jgi:acyl carrier protein